MRRWTTVRGRSRSGALARLVCSLPLVPLAALPCAGQGVSSQQAPAPIERRPPPAYTARPAQGATGSYAVLRPGSGNAVVPGSGTASRNAGKGVASGVPRGVHLTQWMSQHSNLTPEEQQRALGQEPGFDRLPTETQQRVRQRLSQLDAMPPTQRQRVLERTEALERLQPEQRAEVRGAMSQLGALPQEQRRVVARTFRALRDLPLEQRAAALASGRYGPPLDPAGQAALQGLLRVEPLLPPPARAQAPQTFAPGVGQPSFQPAQPVYPPQ